MPPNNDADPYIGPASKKIGKNLAVHSVLERSAGLEFRLLGSRDLNGFTGPRIAAHACLALANGESTEATKLDPVATFKRATDLVENCADKTFDITVV